VPVSGADHHLPALGDARLDEAVLRQQLAQAHAWTPELSGDGRWGSGRAPASAAVLVPLVRREHGLTVLLTRRTEHLRHHGGQISFPGGRSEPDDADSGATAMREAQEELGLQPSLVELIGQLPAYTTVTHYVVTPVVGLVRTPLSLAPDPGEVAEVFEVPLAFLMNPAHHQRHVFEFDGGERQFLSMPWTGAGADGVRREYFIWGATAAMLRNFYSLLAR